MSSLEPSVPPWATAHPTGPAAAWGLPELAVPAPDADPEFVPDPLEAAARRGYDEGFLAGMSQAREELEPAREALGRAIGEVRREMASVRDRAESNVLALALAVARWLMQREVAADPASVEPLLRRAVALLPASSTIGIHANPGDVDALGNKIDFVEPDGRPIAIHWIADPSLESGSFRLVSPERIIDGRVDTALRMLYERLAGA